MFIRTDATATDEYMFVFQFFYLLKITHNIQRRSQISKMERFAKVVNGFWR